MIREYFIYDTRGEFQGLVLATSGPHALAHYDAHKRAGQLPAKTAVLPTRPLPPRWWKRTAAHDR